MSPQLRRVSPDLGFLPGGVGKSCLTGKLLLTEDIEILQVWYSHPLVAQFVHNEWIESYDPTIEDSYRTQIQVDVSCRIPLGAHHG